MRFPDLSRERCHEELHLVDEWGQVLTGAAAVRGTLERLPGAFLISFPFHIPGGMWLAHRAYRWVSRNRRRLAGWLR